MKKIFFTPILLFLTISIYICAEPTELYQKGTEYQVNEDWYSAIELYQTALQENPAYNLAYQRLAECFYALNEYDQALHFVRTAASFKYQDPDLKNLEGFILIGLGKITEAQDIFKTILRTYPNNSEARFGLAEIEVLNGRFYAASDIYKQTLFKQAENRKALLSLALISHETGNIKLATDYINKALLYHGDNPQVHYFAAYLSVLENNLEEAEGRLRNAIRLKNNYDDAYSLLAAILYAQKRYEEAISITDIRIAKKRNIAEAWYLKALCLLNMDKKNEAMINAKISLSINPENEIIRALLENIAFKNLDFEDKFRKELSKYHSEKGLGFARRNMSDQALYEYRRALKLYPYDAQSREAYAKILLRFGYPARYLEQLLFIQSISKSNNNVNDAVEAYSKNLLTSIQTKWKIDPLSLDKAHLSISLFYEKENANIIHPEAEQITQILTADILANSPRFNIFPHSDKSTEYKEAFKKAREENSDYFGIIKLKENERDIHLILELYVSRTGSHAKTFNVYRSGNDRFSNAIRRLVKIFSEEMPIVGRIVNRYQNEAVIDIGKHDADMSDYKIAIIKKDSLIADKDGIALIYPPSDILGYFVPSRSEEDLTEGHLELAGYYDRISKGDAVILIKPEEKQEETEDYTNAEQKYSGIFLLLRRIR